MGTATWAWNNQREAPEHYGHDVIANGKITLSSSYATDGDSIDFSAVSGIRDVKKVVIQATDGTLMFVADLPNNKVLCFDALGAQETATDDLSGVTLDAQIIGNM